MKEASQVNFREIPQFTKSGSYQVNMGMEFLIKQIDTWVEEEGLQLNPDFQRGMFGTKASR